MSANVDKLQALIVREIERATSQLPAEPTADDIRRWRQSMATAIATGHRAAAEAGHKDRTGSTGPRSPLSAIDNQRLVERLGTQLQYLNGFVAELPGLSIAERNARALLYSGAVRATYSETRWSGYNLPAHPGDGTQCIVNCRCYWTVDEEKRLAYWRLSSGEPCPTCQSRASRYNPYRLDRTRISVPAG